MIIKNLLILFKVLLNILWVEIRGGLNNISGGGATVCTKKCIAPSPGPPPKN